MQSSPQKLRRRLLVYSITLLSLPVVFIGGCLLLAGAGLVGGLYLSETDPRFFVIAVIAIIAAGAAIYAFLNGITARFPQIRRQKLNPADFPELFALVEEVRKHAGGPAIDAIVIEPFLNASVSEEWDSLRARRSRYTLVIGLEIMELLSVEEFRSTVAHEMGHLAARDTYYRTWLSRTLLCWRQIFDTAATNERSVRLLSRIWSFFHEPISMIELAVSRQAEERADQIEASITSPQVAAQSLLRFDLYTAALFYHYEPSLHLQKGTEPVPPEDIYLRRLEFLRTPMDAGMEADVRRIAFSLATTFEHTHPAPRPRLAALGFPNPDLLPLQPVRERATTLLGQRYESIVAQMSKKHRMEIIDGWRQTFEAKRREAIELSELKGRLEKDPDNVRDGWRRYQIEASLAHHDESISIVEHFIEEHPDHPHARFTRGQLLIQRMDARGIPELEFGMRDPSLRPEGLDSLLNFYFIQGRYEELEEVSRRADAFVLEHERAAKERKSFGPGVPLTAPRLDRDQIAALNAAGMRNQRVVSIRVARAELRYLPSQDFHVIIVQLDPGYQSLHQAAYYQVGTAAEFPNRIIVTPDPSSRWIEKARRIPETLIYTR